MTIDYYIQTNEIKLDGRYASQLKTFKLSIGAVMEDFVQVVMQYFYFEKYLLEERKGSLEACTVVLYNSQLNPVKIVCLRERITNADHNTIIH